MPWQTTPFTAPYLVAAGALLVVALYVVRQQRLYEPVPGGYLAVVLSVTVAATVLAGTIELGVVGAEAKLLWRKVAYLCGAPAPAVLLLFTLRYTGADGYLDWGTAGVATVPPAAMAVLAVTNEVHGLVWSSVGPPTAGVHPSLAVEYGRFSLVFAGYAGLVVVASAVRLAHRAVRSEGIYRRQAAMLAGGVLVPPLAVGAAARFGGLPVPLVDVAVLSGVVTAGTFCWGIARHGLFTLVPVASRTAVQQMDDAVVVIDVRGLVVSVNPEAEPFLTVPAAEATGRSVGEVLRPVAVPPAPAGAERSHRETVTDGETGRHYQRVGTPLTDDDGVLLGELVVLRDITERTRREERLQRQNEQLEEFASVVSHDLRNPLNVISARTQLARETCADEHFDALEDAAERMDRLIDDLLQLARQGQTVGETEEVWLSEVAADAWATVEAPDATFEVRGDETVEADRERLRQAFENLFRNSVEHGSANGHPGADDRVEHGSTGGGPGDGAADVTVCVEAIEDGIAVVDDGPGIPEDRRDEVFEYGYTTDDDGTGFGLSIVEEIVEAHGWDIEVTGSDAGGARFEITGIDTAGNVSLAATEAD